MHFGGSETMIPLAIPNLQGNEAAYLQECIDTTFVSTVGPFVARFEERLAEISGTPSACVLSCGTTALQLALEGLGVGPGDLVMLPSLTFIATPNSVRHARADVWLADVSQEDWAFDVEKARISILQATDPHPAGRLHRETGKILKALMPVMIMGSVLDLDAIARLAEEFNLKVVVDAAAAIGTTGQNGMPLGQSKVDAICYSFNGNKTVTCGGGGAVASKDGELIEKVKHLSSTGRIGANYDHDVVAYNHRMTNLQAAVGVAQLERLDEFLNRKTFIFERYSKWTEQFTCLSPFPNATFGRNGHWFSGFWYNGSCDGIDTSFQSHMRSNGIDLRPFWKPIHLQAPYIDAVRNEMAVTDDIWRRIFPLPCSTHLTEGELQTTLDAAHSFWASHSEG